MRSTIRNFLAASAAGAAIFAAVPAFAQEEAKIGIILGFTGPLETITPGMAGSAELAIKEVNDSGQLLNGTKLTPVRADSTCIDAAAAQAAAERLVTAENVAAIMGADCSGVTIAIANNVAVPNGVVMISPSATSPALTTIEDKDYFFRTAPSDARQGEVLSEILIGKDVKSVAVTYTNNDYGKGDYSAEVGALASAGGDLLVVLGYVDQGGVGIIRAAVESGAFDTFALGDGMYGQSLIDAIGDDLNGTVGLIPGAEGDGMEAFKKVATAGSLDPSSSYTGESYDAAALIALAMQKAGSTDRTAIRDAILDVANAPGEKILAGELAKGLEILKSGGDIDYVGATNVELIGPGEAAGTYREYEVKDGKFETIKFH